MAKIEVTQQTLDFIAGWEGFHSTSYWDVSRWSIGFGTPANNEHETITQEQALDLMGIDLAKRANKLAKQISFAPTPNQATALLSAAFNLGSVPNKVLAHCNNGAFDLAGLELVKYCWAGTGDQKKKLPALVRRREAECRLLVDEVDQVTKGKPRVQYSRVYHLLDQNASIDQFVAVAREAWEDRSTVGFSYDDAGIGDLGSKTVVLHGTHPDNIVDWFAQHYPNAKVVQDQVTPKTPQKPSVGQIKALWGLHGSADGSWGNPVLTETQDMIKTAKIQAVKLLSNESSDSVPILHNINPDIFILIRLFAKVDDEHNSASDFIHTVGAQARSFYDKGVRYFEVHNEPNLYVEGFGSAWADGHQFSTFFSHIIRSLEEDMPEAKWGYPGLSPNFSIKNVRYDCMRFWNESWQAREQADFICAHSYFTSDADMDSSDGGQWYKRYDTQGKLLMLTEFSNVSKDVPKDKKGVQYNRYVEKLEGVHSAYCFLSTASGGFDHETWSGSPIATIVGNRNYE
jgi:GH24 family phage-related lysozyme (muramidase)